VNTESQIRREIVADRRMSVNAKKREDYRHRWPGHPVRAGQQRRGKNVSSVEIADRIAHAGNVDNQLDVMFTVSSSN